MGEQAVHLSKARLAGRTLSNLARKPRICGRGINTSKSDMKQRSKRALKKRAFKKTCFYHFMNTKYKFKLCEHNKGLTIERHKLMKT